MSSSEYGLCIDQAIVRDLVMEVNKTSKNMGAHDKRKSLYFKIFFVQAISGKSQHET